MLGYDCHCPTGFEGKNCDEKSSGIVDTNTISTSEPESPSTPTPTESMAATDSTTLTPADSTLQSTFPVSTSGPATTTASSASTDATTITPSDSTLPATSPTSISSPNTTTASSASTDATTITPSDSTMQETSPTSTSSPTTTTASSASTDATTITPSDSTLQATSPTSTSSPTTTTVLPASTDATAITQSDSTLQATSPTSISSPTTTTASSESTDATTVTPSDSTQPETSPTSASAPLMTTGSTTPTDATTITPSDSTLPVTSPTSTSGPPTTTASSARTDATTVTPPDSTLPVTTSTSTARPPTATGSSAKIFVSDAGADAIFVSEMADTLSFTSFLSSRNPNYIKYDPTERHIYWSDWTDRCVYRANLNGTGQEQVTAAGSYPPYGIAIAERSRILYIAYLHAHKVTSMSIERGSPLPGTETDFVNQSISYPRALIIDEEEGFLYISWYHGIVRALLNATNDIEEIYHNEDLTGFPGLSIDLNRHPRRIFFSDWSQKRTFFKDLTTGANSNTSTAVELTEYTHNPYQEALADVIYFKGTLYWVKSNDPKGIGIMTNYDQTNRSYRVQEISQFEKPLRMLIIT